MSWLWGAEDDESGHARRTRRPRRGSAARSLLALLAVAAVLGAGVLGVVALLRSIEPSAPEATLTCSAGQFSVDVDQAANAALIVGTTVRRDLPARAGTIGIATALQESWMRNIDFGDRDSLGMFQQRPSQGWGTPEQVMDPVYATNIFYDHLVQVDRYTEMAVTEAAQAVQRSGFPDAYAQHEPLARVFASALTGWTEADLTCSLEAHVGDAAYVPEAVLERMERDYGIVGELGRGAGRTRLRLTTAAPRTARRRTRPRPTAAPPLPLSTQAPSGAARRRRRGQPGPRPRVPWLRRRRPEQGRCWSTGGPGSATLGSGASSRSASPGRGPASSSSFPDHCSSTSRYADLVPPTGRLRTSRGPTSYPGRADFVPRASPCRTRDPSSSCSTVPTLPRPRPSVSGIGRPPDPSAVHSGS
ncbi:hypothetical protein [Salana multivorans]